MSLTRAHSTGIDDRSCRQMTAEEYFQLPAGPPYSQLIDGRLVMSPSPFFFHQSLVLAIATEFRNFLRKNRVGVVQIAPSDVHLDGGNVFQPDVYFVRNERRTLIDRQGLKGAPDLVVEVISGRTARIDLGPKKRIYAESGVLEFWAVFPDEEEIEVYDLPISVETPARRFGRGDTIATPLVPGLEIPLDLLFE